MKLDQTQLSHTCSSSFSEPLVFKCTKRSETQREARTAGWQSYPQSAPGKSSHPGGVLTTSVVRVAANASGLFPNFEYLIFYLVVLLPKMSMLGQVGSTSVLSHRQHNRLGMFYVSLMGFNIHSPTVQNVRSPLFEGQKHVKHTHTDKHCSEIVMLYIKPE